MSQVVLPFNLQNDADADADQVMANYTAITGVVNGSLQAGTNITTGTAREVSSGSSEGSSLNVARSDHTHSVQGLERLSADPASGNFVGREYFNTATLKTRLCIALPSTWVTTGNLDATDVPVHASRHASGGADPLPANSVTESMLAARTIYLGVPSADVDLTANSWTDIVTGLAVTVTGTQVGWLVPNVAITNPGVVSPVVSARVIDGASAVLWQSPSRQMSAAGSSNDAAEITAVYPVSFSASPTLKMQVNTNASTGANKVSVKKSQTQNGSAFAVTSLSVVVG